MSGSSKPADRRTLTILALVLAAVVVGSVAHIFWKRSTLATLTTGRGRVVEIERRSGHTGGKSTTQRIPVAEVRLATGALVRAPLEPSSNSPFCCDVGEELDVLYDPADPAGTAQANKAGDLYGPQAAFAAVAGLFLVVIGAALRRAG
ncbi:MAG TPA: DUF3592 domain-containing protein [Polyangiaceae bacterium]|nr:DUF3592 domain-containing protein [Polyangiaceae bacterium]